jgi:hypothetical protein
MKLMGKPCARTLNNAPEMRDFVRLLVWTFIYGHLLFGGLPQLAQSTHFPVEFEQQAAVDGQPPKARTDAQASAV